MFCSIVYYIGTCSLVQDFYESLPRELLSEVISDLAFIHMKLNFDASDLVTEIGPGLWMRKSGQGGDEVASFVTLFDSNLVILHGARITDSFSQDREGEIAQERYQNLF